MLYVSWWSFPGKYHIIVVAIPTALKNNPLILQAWQHWKAGSDQGTCEAREGGLKMFLNLIN